MRTIDVPSSRFTNLYLLPWEVMSVSSQGLCRVSKYRDPSIIESVIDVRSSMTFGPYAVGTGFKIDSLSGSALITISDSVSGEVVVDPKISETPVSISNQLINVLPTNYAFPYTGTETIAYDSADAGMSLDDTRYDPSSGLPYVLSTIPNPSTVHRRVNYLDRAPKVMAPNDVWMVSVYLPERKPAIQIKLILSSEATVGSNIRTFVFEGNTLQRGYNLLTCMHVEDQQTVNGHIAGKTNIREQWTNSGTMTDSSTVISAAVEVGVTSADGTTTFIYLGSIYTAPAGWARGAVMWGADDIQSSFIDLAAPIIESYGWNYTINVTSTYTIDTTLGHATIAQVKDSQSKGNEVWGHTRRHENMDTVTTDQKTKAIVAANDFWRGQGIESASRFMAWPFGAYDDEAITIAKADDMLLAASIHGEQINPFMAGVNPFYLNRFVAEQVNSWLVDAHLNGSILRGTGVISYMHGAVEGGGDQFNYPEANRFYTEHLRRWCDLVAEHEAAGRCVVTTPLRYLKMCGIDPYTHKFAE